MGLSCLLKGVTTPDVSKVYVVVPHRACITQDWLIVTVDEKATSTLAILSGVSKEVDLDFVI